MPDIRYVCLSDLHFGAENSILTCLRPNSVEADPDKPSIVMTAVAECLNTLVSQNEGDDKPSLILCGDILELALSTDNIAAMVFSRFIELLFPPSGSQFSKTIYFVPGNHDHHLWEGAREREYARYLEERPLGEFLEVPWHASYLFPEQEPNAFTAEVLATLVRRYPHLRDAEVRAVYPNLGMIDKGTSHAVVFHHGHFVEGLYRLMSVLKTMVFPHRSTPENVWDWESENFAWIDFFWSTLGRSGEVGTDVGLVYACLQSDKAMKKLAGNLADGISGRLRGPKAVRWAESKAIRFGLEKLVERIGRLERVEPKDALSSRARTGLELYLKGPLRNQLLGECNHTLPDQVTFIFGHTHKPFETLLSPDGYGRAVEVYNTGGWVVDTLDPRPLQGGSAILLDEELNTVALRFYNQTLDGSVSRVELKVADSTTAGENALYQRLNSLLDTEKQPWVNLCSAAAQIVKERHADMATIVDQVANTME